MRPALFVEVVVLALIFSAPFIYVGLSQAEINIDRHYYDDYQECQKELQKAEQKNECKCQCDCGPWPFLFVAVIAVAAMVLYHKYYKPEEKDEGEPDEEHNREE